MHILKRSFKMQKIMFFMYLFVVILEFIFAVSFMTQYSNLFGLELPLNDGIRIFHDNMQIFDRFMFYSSLVGLVSIIFIYALEVNKKVCDRFALIVLGVFVAFLIGSSIFSLIRLTQLLGEYKSVDFKYISIEDPEIVDYQLRFETFYIGYVLNAFSILVFLIFLGNLIFNHIKFLKLKKEGALNDN